MSAANWLVDEIARRGPIPVAEFMTLALTHPEHGYYCRQEAFGRAGDFVTAPEISQVFGELIGIWCLAVWDGMGRPERWRLVELGPGRGTLMRDALRAISLIPACRAGLAIELVEISPKLMATQRVTLAAALDHIGWPARFVPSPIPTIVVANEFLDTLPVSQWLKTAEGWRSRLVVATETGGLQYCTEPSTALPSGMPDVPAEDGAIFEQRNGFDPLCRDLAEQAAMAPLAGLFIDYGHVASGFGDTLQAVSRHAYWPALMEPGSADLSAQVDFAALANMAQRHGLACATPLSQTEFLGRLGIVERTERLVAGADARRRASLEAGIARLISPDAMGTRFKVFGVASKGLTLPAFSLTG